MRRFSSWKGQNRDRCRSCHRTYGMRCEHRRHQSTILGEDEIFSMTMLVTLNPEVCGFDATQDRLTAAGAQMGTQINIQREDVFRFMHEV